MSDQTPKQVDQMMARKARMVSIVIVVTMLVWLLGQWVGGKIGLDKSYAFLLDLAALAAFFWALVVIYQIWRLRRGS